MRLLGMKGLALANHIGLLTALPMLPCLLPDPDLSKAAFRHIGEALSGLLRTLGRVLLIAAAGRSPPSASPRLEAARRAAQRLSDLPRRRRGSWSPAPAIGSARPASR